MLLLESLAFEFYWLWAALIWPLPFLFRLLPPRKVTAQALRVPFFERIADLPQAVITQKVFSKFLIPATIVWSSIVLAAMRPQWVGEAVELPVTGRSVMLAVDLSGSMKEKDLEIEGRAVTRLEVVKYVLRPFIERRKGDRLGLILFGDQAYLQTPLTFDRQTLGQMLEESELGLAGQRTAIGSAIGLAVKRMKDLPDTQKVLILLTDGQNTAGEVSPEDAGILAKETGLRIHTIGVGADEVWVRTFLGTQKINPSSELDEVLLQSLASDTGGNYFRARSTEELENIYSMIDVIEPVEVEKEVFRPRQSLYVWPLGFAVLAIGSWFLILIYRN